ncbi:MAG: hypothetical protein P8105_05850 [Dehalococcoidia bacterium]
MNEEKTWMPLTAGILTIISAAIKLITAIGAAIGLAVYTTGSHCSIGISETAILAGIMVPFLILGVVALIGGIYALRREKWGMALAGSIAAFLPTSILGVVAIIFVAISKKEFK